MLTENTHFKYDISLPQTDQNIGLGEELKNYISDLEPQLLSKLLGAKMANDLYAHINDGSGIWHELINGADFTDKLGRANYWNGFKTVGYNPLAYLIYYSWVREYSSTLTSLGTTQANMQNAQMISPNDKLVAAWNKMVELLLVMDDYIMQNKADFPDYLGVTYSPFATYNLLPNAQYFQTINVMGI